MLGQFNINNIDILDVIHCPHLPSDLCDGRKPQPGMFLAAKIKHNIDMKNSWMIGDQENDIKAANNAGIMNTILVKSGHNVCLLYTSPSPRDGLLSRMPSSA